MPTLILSGSLAEIRQKLQALKATCERRNIEGWSQFELAFEYRYNTADDGRVCPTCVPINGQLYRGAYIPDMFPYAEPIRDDYILAKNETNFHHANRCRCTLTMTNKAEAVVELLFADFKVAVT